MNRENIVLIVTSFLMLTSICMPLDAVGGESVPGRVPFEMALAHVNVTFPGGSPVNMAEVHIHRYDQAYNYPNNNLGTTNLMGQTNIIVSPYNLGPCYVTYFNSTKLAFSRAEVYIEPDDEIWLDLVLHDHVQPTVRFYGEVTDALTGEGIPPANQITASGWDELGKWRQFNAETEPDGSYEMMIAPSPNTYSMSVSHSGATVYRYYSMDFQLAEGETSRRMDISLREEESYDVPLNIHLTNSTTGRPIDSGYVYCEGFVAEREHSSNDLSSLPPLNSEGWTNTTADRGEYWFQWRGGIPDPVSCEVRIQTWIMVNDTAKDVEIGIAVPDEWRPVELTILDDESGDPINMAFSGISKLFGGVFFPVTILPPFLQSFSAVLPITYALTAMRKAILLGASPAELIPECLVLILFSVVLIPAGLICFRAALRKAKKDGSLLYS